MPTTCNKLLLAALAACLTAAPLTEARAGESDTTFSLLLFAGGGYTRNLSSFETEPLGLNRDGLTGALRVMWKPDHLLSVGLETGYHRVYAAGSELDTGGVSISGESSLDAVPIQIVLSMPIFDRLEAWLGLGAAVLTSHVRFFDESTTTSTITPYMYGALSYLYPVASDLRLGGEVRVAYMDRFIDTNLSFQLMLSWTFHTY